MNKIRSLLMRTYRHFMYDSLYRNSIYLMVSTVVMSGVGFIFWYLAAKAYDTSDIGIATALIAMITLLANLSILGLNNSLIRFIPPSNNKNNLINTSLSVIIIMSVIVSVGYLLCVDFVSPSLSFVRGGVVIALVFITFVIATALNSITDSIFIAYKVGGFVLLSGLTVSLVKLMLLPLLTNMNYKGIIIANSLGIVAALLLSLWLMIRSFKYRIKVLVDSDIVKHIAKYSMHNYFITIISTASISLLPLIVLHELGAKASAYYYISMMIATATFIIPQAVSQSLFAEGSHNPERLFAATKKSAKAIILLGLPAVAIISIACPYVLNLFGADYVSNAATMLRLFVYSYFLVSLNTVASILLRVTNRTGELLIITLVQQLAILGGSYYLANMGLVGIGWAWLGGQALMSIILAARYVPIVRSYK